MLKEYLMETSAKMNLALSDEQAGKLVRFHEMLLKANEKMNLTRVSPDWQEAADRNYLDSIAPAAYLPHGLENLVDVGTGAGFPGVPIAIFRPDVRVTLMDSLGKRVEFLKNVVEELGLNARAVHIRAEDAGRKEIYRENFDAAISRAVASMNVLCELCLPLAKVGGQLLALKGPGLEEEAVQAKNAIDVLGGKILSQHVLNIPGRDWDHRLCIVEKISATPEKYPRRAGMPEKKPIL